MIAITGRQSPLTVDFGRKKGSLAHVGYQLRNADGTLHVARTEVGVTHLLAGIYVVQAPTLTAGWNGYVVWDTGETEPVYAIEAIEVANLDYLDAAVSSRATTINLANTSIQVVGPVSTTGAITIIAGDDYKAVDSRALVWEDSTGTRWPSLAGASITLQVYSDSGGPKFSADGVEISVSAPARRVSVDIDGTDTAGVPGAWRYQLVATLSDGGTVTLSTGSFAVKSPFAA